MSQRYIYSSPSLSCRGNSRRVHPVITNIRERWVAFGREVRRETGLHYYFRPCETDSAVQTRALAHMYVYVSSACITPAYIHIHDVPGEKAKRGREMGNSVVDVRAPIECRRRLIGLPGLMGYSYTHIHIFRFIYSYIFPYRIYRVNVAAHEEFDLSLRLHREKDDKNPLDPRARVCLHLTRTHLPENTAIIQH